MKRKDHSPAPSVMSSSIPKKVKSPSVNETSSTSYSTEEQRERAKIWAEKLKKDNLTTIDNATREAIEAAKRKHDRSMATTSTASSSSTIEATNHEVISSTLLLSSSKSSLETARLAIEAARLNRERQAATSIMRCDVQTNPPTATSAAAVGPQQQQQHVDYFDQDNDRSSIRSNSIADSVSSRRKSLRGKVVLQRVPEDEAVQTAIILGSLHHHHQSNQQRLSSSSSSSSNHHEPLTSSLSVAATATATVVKPSASITSSGSKKKKAATPKKTKPKGVTDNDDDDVDYTDATSAPHQSIDLTTTTSSSAAAVFEYRHPALDVYHLLPLENKTTSFISQPYVWVILSLSLVVLGLVKYHEIDVSQMNFTDFTRDIGKCLL